MNTDAEMWCGIGLKYLCPSVKSVVLNPLRSVSSEVAEGMEESWWSGELPLWFKELGESPGPVTGPRGCGTDGRAL